MGSLQDFVRSAASDAMLPFVRQLLEDVVMEVINDRQIPSRTDFHELRDVVNKLRGEVTSVAPAVRRIERTLEDHARRIEALESALRGG